LAYEICDHFTAPMKWRNGHAFDIFEFIPHDRAGFLDGEFTEILEAVRFKDTCNSK